MLYGKTLRNARQRRPYFGNINNGALRSNVMHYIGSIAKIWVSQGTEQQPLGINIFICGERYFDAFQLLC